MTERADQTDEKLTDCIEEFAAFAGLDAAGIAASLIYRSDDFPDDRMVFTLVGDGFEPLSLKTDFEEGTDRLLTEYAVIERLRGHFEDDERNQVIQPVYASPKGHFHVTTFISGRTAKDVVYHAENENQVAQAYRRGGQWLDHLHRVAPQPPKSVWLNWMLESLDPLLDAPETVMPHSLLKRYCDQLAQEIAPFQGRLETAAFSHGDFHGGNLILGPGINIGLDFTEAHDKTSCYDIVDFLKMDVMRHCSPAQIGSDGLSEGTRDMFFRGYKLPISQPLLTVCIKGRLLIELASITEEKHAGSSFQRRKYDSLILRLEKAFAEN